MHDDDYRVGPGRPPREHRFKKGQSGNPKGRPTGSKDYRTVLQEALQASVTLAGSGEQISMLEALVKQLCLKGCKGDLRAIAMALDRAERLAAPQTADSPDCAEEDEAILRRHVRSDCNAEPETA